jgi:uncharacterized repeat protein (TIGR03803 family)
LNCKTTRTIEEITMNSTSFYSGSRRIPLAIAVLVLAVVTSTTAKAQTFSVLHDFLGTNSGDGSHPTYSGIVAQGRDGNMYGTTYDGGAPMEVNVGTVFQVTPAGVLTVIHSFRGDQTEG